MQVNKQDLGQHVSYRCSGLHHKSCRQLQLNKMLTASPSAAADGCKDVEVAHANVYLQLTLDNNGLHQVYSVCLALHGVALLCSNA